MTDTTISKDPTAAERARRYRARKREQGQNNLPAVRDQTSVTNDAQPVTLPSRPDSVMVTTAYPEPIHRPVARWTAGAIFLVAIAFAIAALALFVNGQTGWHFGTTPFAAVTFAGLSLAADLLAIVLPATAAALWCGRHRLLAAAAWGVWVIAAAMATLASLGFAELHIGDTAAGRQSVITTSASLATQREDRIAAARLASTAATKAREAECAKRGPLCRDREADERTALVGLNSAVAAPVPTAANIAGADPQVTAALRLATWGGLGLHADDIVNLRLALMALLPNLAGLLLAFAAGLARPLPARFPGDNLGSRTGKNFRQVFVRTMEKEQGRGLARSPDSM